jgi:hypothetical protein
MATIDWASAVNGTFSTAADWAGGVAPGAQDTAVINAVPPLHGLPYTVELRTAVTLGGLVLDANAARLAATANITAGNIAVEAGRLEMDGATLNGSTTLSGGLLQLDDAAFRGGLDITGGALRLTRSSISGTIAQSGGIVVFGNDVVLNDVTWQGTLDPVQNGTLVVKNGLTLTGANGIGPGTATLDGSVVLDNVAALNNATITVANLDVQDTRTLTLGGQLTLVDSALALTAGETVVNSGTFTGTESGAGVSGGSFLNDGEISGYFTEAAQSFSNNGLITAGSGQVIRLALAGLQAAGATASIVLNNADLLLTGDLTTAQLQSLYAAQHVSGTGEFGFGLIGTLTNNGATLQLGTGSALGALSYYSTATIIGGTIMDAGGYQDGILTLQDVAYAGSGTVALGFDSWTDVTLTGATALLARSLSLTDCSLSNVTNITVEGNLALEGVTSAAPLNVVFTGAYGSDYLTLGAGQSVAGDSFTFGVVGVSELADVAVAGGLTLNDVSFDFTTGFDNELVDSSSSQGITLGTSFTATLANAVGTFDELSLLSQGSNSAINSAGTFTVDGALIVGGPGAAGTSAGTPTTHVNNSGLITVGANGILYIDPKYGHLTNTGTILVNGGTLEASVADLQNSGSLSVTDGTLVLDGPLKVANLDQFADPGSALQIAGTLDLAGASITPGEDGVQGFSLLGGAVTDGTLHIAAGDALAALSVGDGTDNPSISAALVNNGTLVATLGNTADVDQSQLTLTGPVTGNGTIALQSGGGSGFPSFCTVTLGAAVAASQTIAFISGYDTLEFTNASAAAHFAGTITGLDSGNSIDQTFQFDHETVKSALVSSHDILVTFSNGDSLTLVSSATLHGNVSVLNSDGDGMVMYARPTAADLSQH